MCQSYQKWNHVRKSGELLTLKGGLREDAARTEELNWCFPHPSLSQSRSQRSPWWMLLVRSQQRPCLKLQCLLRGHKGDEMYAFKASARTGCVNTGVLNEFKDGIVELWSERLRSSVEAAMVPEGCSASHDFQNRSQRSSGNSLTSRTRQTDKTSKK